MVGFTVVEVSQLRAADSIPTIMGMVRYQSTPNYEQSDWADNLY